MSDTKVQDFLRRRICLTLPRMSEVVVRRDVPYAGEDGNRVMDIYDLPRTTPGLRGAVVIVAGYPDRAPAAERRGYRDIGWTTSNGAARCRVGPGCCRLYDARSGGRSAGRAPPLAFTRRRPGRRCTAPRRARGIRQRADGAASV